MIPIDWYSKWIQCIRFEQWRIYAKHVPHSLWRGEEMLRGVSRRGGGRMREGDRTDRANEENSETEREGRGGGRRKKRWNHKKSHGWDNWGNSVYVYKQPVFPILAYNNKQNKSILKLEILKWMQSSAEERRVRVRIVWRILYCVVQTSCMCVLLMKYMLKQSYTIISIDKLA